MIEYDILEATVHPYDGVEKSIVNIAREGGRNLGSGTPLNRVSEYVAWKKSWKRDAYIWFWRHHWDWGYSSYEWKNPSALIRMWYWGLRRIRMIFAPPYSFQALSFQEKIAAGIMLGQGPNIGNLPDVSGYRRLWLSFIPQLSYFKEFLHHTRQV